jgi:hypothetical protein
MTSITVHPATAFACRFATNDYVESMYGFKPCLKMSLSRIASKRSTAAPAANSKRFTGVLDLNSARYVGGRMMVKMTTTQIKCAAGQMAPLA